MTADRSLSFSKSWCPHTKKHGDYKVLTSKADCGCSRILYRLKHPALPHAKNFDIYLSIFMSIHSTLTLFSFICILLVKKPQALITTLLGEEAKTGARQTMEMREEGRAGGDSGWSVSFHRSYSASANCFHTILGLLSHHLMLATIQTLQLGKKKNRLEPSGLRYNLCWGYFYCEGSASKERLADLARLREITFSTFQPDLKSQLCWRKASSSHRLPVNCQLRSD